MRERSAVPRVRKKSGWQPLLLALPSLIFVGCGTLKDGKAWGEEAVWPIEWRRVGTAALHSLLDPVVLAGTAGALIVSIDDWDEKVSDWAVDESPIFGSVENAKDWSDDLRSALRAEAAATSLGTASGDEAGEWSVNKLRGFSIGAAAVFATDGMTNFLKDDINRTRPDGGDGSFPSSHTSASFAAMTLSNRNIDSIPQLRRVRRPLQAANLIMATGVGWARVEGEKHFPSDVLAGAAIGRFITLFLYDAFLHPPDDAHPILEFEASPVGATAQLVFPF